MIQENEVVMLILGLGVFIFILASWSQLKRFESSRILIFAFFFLFIGWVFTVLESFLWEDVLNYMEHICYGAASSLVAVWCWIIFRTSKEAR